MIPITNMSLSQTARGDKKMKNRIHEVFINKNNKSLPELRAILLGAVAGLSLFGASAEAGELRVGIAQHDITDRESGRNFQPQYVFDQAFFWNLKPYVMASINTDDNLTYGGAGLLKEWVFGNDWFSEVQFGLIAHSGRVDLPPPDQFIERQHVLDTEVTYGCEALFEESVSFGRILEGGYRISGYYEHLSHGKILCQNGKNEGLDNLGVRFGWSF